MLKVSIKIGDLGHSGMSPPKISAFPLVQPDSRPSELMALYGLDATHIAEAALKLVK